MIRRAHHIWITTVVTVAATTLVASAASAQYRRKPVLQDYNSRMIVGNEVYSPTRNTFRDGNTARQAPDTGAERPAGAGDAVAPKPEVKPTAAQCVAGCG